MDERLLWIKLNMPEKLNILNLKMLRELYSALVKADKDRKVQAILVTSVGKGFFSRGECKGAIALQL